MKSLAICALIRDEAPYMAEWLEFHRLVGVSRFVLYDDHSTDGTRNVILEHDRGDITLYHHGPAWDSPEYDGISMPMGWHTYLQARAFAHYDQHHGPETFWCAYIDPDEYLFHESIDWLPTALEPFEDECGLVVNWLIFGSNGHQTHPPGLTIENYTRRAIPGEPEPWGRHVKPIVHTTRRRRWGPNGSHCPVFDDGCWPVDQLHRPNPWSMTPCAPTSLAFRLHHYYHRSQEEAAAKLVRGYHNIPVGYPGQERLTAHDRNEVEDTTALRFVPRLKEALCQ